MNTSVLKCSALSATIVLATVGMGLKPAHAGWFVEVDPVTGETPILDLNAPKSSVALTADNPQRQQRDDKPPREQTASVTFTFQWRGIGRPQGNGTVLIEHRVALASTLTSAANMTDRYNFLSANAQITIVDPDKYYQDPLYYDKKVCDRYTQGVQSSSNPLPSENIYTRNYTVPAVTPVDAQGNSTANFQRTFTLKVTNLAEFSSDYTYGPSIGIASATAGNTTAKTIGVPVATSQ